MNAKAQKRNATPAATAKPETKPEAKAATVTPPTPVTAPRVRLLNLTPKGESVKPIRATTGRYVLASTLLAAPAEGVAMADIAKAIKASGYKCKTTDKAIREGIVILNKYCGYGIAEPTPGYFRAYMPETATAEAK